MLPVQKESREDRGHPAFDDGVKLSSNKVVDSIQTLRDRIEEIDLQALSETAEQITHLRQRLLTIQQTMRVVAEVSAIQSKVLQAQDEVEQDLDRVKTEILNKSLTLRHLGLKDLLASLRGLQKNLTERFNRPDDFVSPAESFVPSTESEEFAVLPAESFSEAAPGTDSLFNDSPEHADDFCPPDVLTAQEQEPVCDTLSNSSSPPDLENSYVEVSQKDIEESPKIEIHAEAQVNPDVMFVDDGEETSEEDSVSEAIQLPAEEPSPSVDVQTTAKIAQDPQPATDSGNSEFDKKLLDDLIKNYGEFVAFSTKPSAAATEPSEPVPVAEPSFNSAQNQTDRANSGAVVSYNHGELDRKLKKLIKDYGEVDIYSQRGSFKTKLHAIGAFALLGAVLSGIYFFSAPKANYASNPTSPHAADQSTNDAGNVIHKTDPAVKHFNQDSAREAAEGGTGASNLNDKQILPKK